MTIDALLHVVYHMVTYSRFLERLFVASTELVLLAFLVLLLERICLKHRPRIVVWLWAIVMLNAMLSLTFDAPLSFNLFQDLVDHNVLAERGRQPSDALVEQTAYAESAGYGVGGYAARSGMDGTVPEVSRLRIFFQNTGGALRRGLESPGHILLTLWLSGILFFLTAAIADRIRLYRLLKSTRDPDHALMQHYQTLLSGYRVKSPPQLKITAALSTPAIVGTFRPVILLPEWMAFATMKHQVHWALKHELNHAVLRDPVLNQGAQVFKILFFFHPLTWWLAKRLKNAMEMACDHSLVQTETERNAYVTNLHAIAMLLRSAPKYRLGCGLFAFHSQLGQRIARLTRMPLDTNQHSHPAIAALIAFTILMLLVGGRVSNSAQAASTRMDADEILATYTAMQEQIQGFKVHYHKDMTYDNRLVGQYAGASGTGRIIHEGWYAHDFMTKKFLDAQYYWKPSNGEVSQDARFRFNHWDGARFYVYMAGKDGRGQIAFEKTKTARLHEERPLMFMSRAFAGKDLLGYPIQAGLRLDEMLQGASLKMDLNTERIGKYECRIIRADTQHGYIKAWFAPDIGCSLVKYEIRKKADEHYKSAKISVSMSAFQREGDLWLPVNGQAKESWWRQDGGFIRRSLKLSLDSYAINPDLDTDGTLDLLQYVEEGSDWYSMEEDRTHYIWVNGNLVLSP